MRYSALPLLLIFLICSYTLHAQKNFQNYPATSEEITITIGKDSIAAFGMFAAGKEKKETVILLHGLPGNERNLDLAHELRRNGRNVIYFNYRGAWGSQGEFLYSNCIEDVAEVMDFFSTPENSTKYRVDPKSFILFGHSMGGGIALLSGAKDDRVKKIAIYSPAHIGTESQEHLDWIATYTKSLFMLNVDPVKFTEELKTEKDAFNALQYKEELSKKDVLIFDENDRNKEWIAKLKNTQYILMKTDHSFSDKRLELIEKISEWIDK